MSESQLRFPLRAQLTPVELERWFQSLVAWLEQDRGLPADLRERMIEASRICSKADRMIAWRRRWFPEISDWSEKIGLLDEEMMSLDTLRERMLPAEFSPQRHCPRCLVEFGQVTALNAHFLQGCRE